MTGGHNFSQAKEARMSSIRQLVCNLMRYNEQNEWSVLSTQSIVTLVSKSISIRCLSTNVLQCDIPLTNVQSLDMIENSCLIRIITLSSCPLALKFSNVDHFNEFKSEIRRENAQINEITKNNSEQLPDLHAAHVQEYILKLLFSDRFRFLTSIVPSKKS